MLFNTFVVTALASLAAATPTRRNEPAAGSCSTGELQCCKSVQSADSKSLTSLFGLLGLVVGDITGLVGVTCSPVTVVGAGGAQCNAQAVCCNDNSFNGLIALGCTPINLNL
ncbi:hypothetical protein PC9H_004807 [Pleurotus ostreatus]|uniref:Class I hydrophobin 10 n=2 Tax=Pleurotus ostreatus TaxID=5322 RepID=HYD10_PLEO1|nr:uncharacterized protein PC9H_004807 [Pleurotus ostreatus]KAF7432863.1 hypothetical protein PC9H_004807 [Pleurotus ostreatus]KDQ29538.1 class I hydrophobin superfamily [Pleurotus ostreatus PC15]